LKENICFFKNFYFISAIILNPNRNIVHFSGKEAVDGKRVRKVVLAYSGGLDTSIIIPGSRKIISAR
jgi:hypothetical protein